MPDRFDLCPKVELHLHLEGAIPLDTMWELIQSCGGDPVVPDRAALVDRLHYTSFAHFIDTWWWMTGFLRSYDAFELIGERVAANLYRQNIIYAEASFSPTDFTRHGLTVQEMADAIRRGLNRVGSTQVVLNCDLVRDTGPQRAMETLAALLEVAVAADVRGITIGGSEQAFPPELFSDVYAHAKRNGLRLTAHAGEAAGAQSVRGALDALGVERIGHGIRVVEDPALMARIVEDQVPLEVCPTSNIRTGVVAGWEGHPVGTLLAAGAHVTISSDDPTFFHASVADDLREVTSRYNADPCELTHQAIDASWMTGDEKANARAAVGSWWENRR